MKRALKKKVPSKLRLSCPNARRELYFFYEKKTGVSHFHLQASPDGQFPVEEAAGLLAMHCMVRGQSPADYIVMVESTHEALSSLAEKAENLLQAGYTVRHAVKLTRREEEVLAGVQRSLANKEIAASLNLSVRTVKFHISSLLSKFHVHGRMELAFKAVGNSPAMVPQPFATREARGYTPAPSYHNGPGLGPNALGRYSEIQRAAELVSRPPVTRSMRSN